MLRRKEMELIDKFKSYLKSVLGISLTLDGENRIEGLPYYLYERYNIYKIKIIKSSFAIMMDTKNEDIRPENIKKQVNLIKEKSKLDVIYVHPALSSFQRDRLIKYKVNFVVPGNQMFLPYLKIDLREHFKSLDQLKMQLTSSSQAIIVYSILNNLSQLDSKIVMESLNFSAMSVSRSFREISGFKIGKLVKKGKLNYLEFPNSGRKLFDSTKTLLKSPVIKVVWFKEIPVNGLFPAGLSALARYSMIAFPPNSEFAIDKREWNKIFRQERIKDLIEPEQTESNIKLQIWSYSPGLNKQNTIDRYSLYLSLQNVKDERIEQALEEMMEEETNGQRN
jgi:hypothetical protein